MTVKRSDGTHHAGVAVTAGALSLGLLLSGCTSSGPGPSEGTWASLPGVAGDRPLVVAFPDGSAVPPDGLEALAEATGLTLQVLDLQPAGNDRELSPASLLGVDVLLGVDPLWLEVSGLYGGGAESDEPQEGIASQSGSLLSSGASLGVDSPGVETRTYGFDDACVLVNRLWFSANDLAVPKDLADLSEDEVRAVVAVSNPYLSPYALAMLPTWDTRWGTWEGGAVLAQPEILPGRIGSQLEAERGGGPVSPESQYRVLPRTCVQRDVAAVIVTKQQQRAQRAQELVDFLVTEPGQQLIAEHFLAVPLTPTAAGQVPQEDDDSSALHSQAHQPYSVTQVQAALADWDRLFSAEPRA